MWQLLPPTALLLLTSTGSRAEDPLMTKVSPTVSLPKAVVSLHPEWDRLLEKDSVTLKCKGSHPEGPSATQWWHNGSLLSAQTSSYLIASARVNDTGEYSCRTNLSAHSDPVQLQVYAGWLLLQARRWVVEEGDTIVLRCHSWKNRSVQKVQYFQDGKIQKFSYQNSDFHILNAVQKHSGSYSCRGLIGKLNVSSEAVNVTVQVVAIPRTPRGSLMLFCLVPGLLFAVDTGLYFSVRRDLRSSPKERLYDKVSWSKSPQDEQEEPKQSS